MAAITAIVTDEGLTNLLTTFNTSSNFLFLKRFEIANTAGSLLSTRTLASINPSWVNLPISGRDNSFPTHITVRCTVPPNTVTSNQIAAEVYIIGEVTGGGEFLFALGQLNAAYDFQGSLSLRIKIPIVDVNLNAIQFNYTQATEVSDHNVDPLAHNDIINATAKAGIPIQLSNHKYIGQHYDEKAVFDVSVTTNMAVYKANDGKYYPAIADGTFKAKIAGYAILSDGIVVVAGFINDPLMTSPNSTDLFLSDTTPGEITGNTTVIKVGLSHGSGLFAFSALGVGGSNGSGNSSIFFEEDFYSDFLDGSIFLRSSFDGFVDETLVDATPTTMNFDALNHRYDFTAGQVLQSINIFDPVSILTTINKLAVWVDHTDNGTPIIEVSVDGGLNWESVTIGNIFVPGFTGNDLRLRFTAGSIGVVNHWGVLYETDNTAIPEAVSRNKIISASYEGIVVDEEDVIDGVKFSNDVAISRASINLRVADGGGTITAFMLLKNSIEVGVPGQFLINSGVKTIETTFAPPISYNVTDTLGIRIKQVGTSSPAQGVNIHLHYFDE